MGSVIYCFLIAVQTGHIKLIQWFLTTYSYKELVNLYQVIFTLHIDAFRLIFPQILAKKYEHE
jgi:hypothetical protein